MSWNTATVGDTAAIPDQSNGTWKFYNGGASYSTWSAPSTPLTWATTAAQAYLKVPCYASGGDVPAVSTTQLITNENGPSDGQVALHPGSGSLLIIRWTSGYTGAASVTFRAWKPGDAGSVLAGLSVHVDGSKTIPAGSSEFLNYSYSTAVEQTFTVSDVAINTTIESPST